MREEVGNVELESVVFDKDSIFSLLREAELEALSSMVEVLLYKKGDYIYNEDDEPAGMLFLYRGKVKIFKGGIGGREQIVRLVSSNAMVGFRSMLVGDMHISSAVALENSTVYRIPKESLFNDLVKNSDFATALLQELAHELGDSNQRTISLTQKHIRGRLAESLILLREKYGFENDGGTLKVYLSRVDIANLSNMTTSNAIRTLSSFASERLIAIDGRMIKILDLDGLERISILG